MLCHVVQLSDLGVFQVFKNLTESIKDIDGARMEDNKFCVSVHYRNVAPHVSLHLRVPFIFTKRSSVK